MCNSSYCPELIKQEFHASQREIEERVIIEDPLVLSPLQQSDDEDTPASQFLVPDDVVIEPPIDDGEDPDYEDETFLNNDFDWSIDRATLINQVGEKGVEDATRWLDIQKGNCNPLPLEDHVDADVNVQFGAETILSSNYRLGRRKT